MNHPIQVDVEEQSLALDRIWQERYNVEQTEKIDLLKDIIIVWHDGRGCWDYQFDGYFDLLKSNGGTLKLNDNSSPEQIKAELNMSKAAFKRSVGRLLKEGAIEITNDGLKLMW